MSNALHECLAQPQLVRMFLVLVQSHVNSSNMLALIRSSILWAGCAVVSFFCSVGEFEVFEDNGFCIMEIILICLSELRDE